jgi:hypothetical protein
MYKIRLFDPFATPLPGAPFTLKDGKRTINDFTDEDAFATIRDLKVPAEVSVTWRHPQDPTQQFSLNIHIDVQGDDQEAAKRRLHNLGFERLPTLADNVKQFQREHRARFAAMQENGELDAATREALAKVHEDCDPTERPRDGSEAGEAGGASA